MSDRPRITPILTNHTMATPTDSGLVGRLTAFVSRLPRCRFRVLTGVLVLLIVSAASVRHIDIENRFEIWFSQDDPMRVNFLQFQEDFGTDESLVLFYRSDSLFSPGELRLNARLTNALVSVPHVNGVLSLSTLEIPRISPFGIGFSPLVPQDPGPQEELKATLTGKGILIDNVISADGSATGVILTLDTLDDDLRLGVVDSIRGLVDQAPFSGREFYLAGNIPIRAEMYRVSSTESGRFVGICALVMLALLWAYFSSLTAAVAAVSVSILTVVVTLGLFSAMGFALNLVAGIIPLVLMVVSLSVSIHIIARVDVVATKTSGLEGIFKDAVRPILKPCLFSALTTGVAFSSFLFSGIGPLRVFGAFCALGVFLSFLLAFLLVPVILTLGGRLPAGFGADRRHDLGRVLEGFVAKTIMRRTLVLAGTVALLVVGVLGLRQLTFETDQIKYLHAANPVREASRVAEEWFSGVYPLEVVLELPDSIQNRPDHYLRLLTGLEEEISSLEEVAVVHSVATALRDFIPEGPFRSLALAALGRQEEFTAGADSGARSGFRYLAPSGTKARLSVKARWMDNEETILLMSRLDRILDPVAVEEDISYFYTGTVPMFVSINRRLTNSQISSFLVSFTCIFLLLLLLFRRLRLAFLGMIPNILPVVTTVGIMGLVGVPMDVATVLIAAISLGIAVDDTIHFLWAFRERQVRGAGDLAALDGAVRAVGRPLILTSLLLVAGFLTMTFSSYLPVVFLGVFVSLNVLLAILLDIILLPALISLSFEEGRSEA